MGIGEVFVGLLAVLPSDTVETVLLRADHEEFGIAQTFADYRSEYFKGAEMVKVIDRDWVPLGKSDDPRAVGWGYWYGKTLATGNQTWAVIPSNVNTVDASYDADWWSEKTLRKIKR